jgi:ectoine hydroxylase-related dioxygenase (phytanoyl-CoA dioxygenase family)
VSALIGERGGTLALAAGAAREYSRNGYYVARALIARPCLDAFLGDMGTIARAQLEHHGIVARAGDDIDALHDNLAALHRHDQKLYLAALVLFGRLKSLYDVFMSPAVSGACRQLGVVLPLMHTFPIFHLMSSRLRLDQGYFGFDAHQDWSGLQSSLNTVVVWLPFHDIDRTSFPLEIAPGSHRAGLCPAVFENNEYTLDAAYRTDDAFVPVEVQQGDVVFMSPFAIHRTGMTGADQLRIAASWRYEDAVEDTFVARRYPLAQSRVVKHALISPGFPDAEQMATVLARIGERDGSV